MKQPYYVFWIYDKSAIKNSAEKLDFFVSFCKVLFSDRKLE